MLFSSLALSLALSTQAAPQDPLYPRVRLDDHLPPVTDNSRPYEQARDFVQRGGDDDLPWTPPQVEMTAREDMSRTALSLAFNWVWLTTGEGRRPVWFARLRAVSYAGTIERFADSRTCPGVEVSLRQLDALPAIDPQVPPLPAPSASGDAVDPFIGYLHDNTYGIRLRGPFSGGRHSDRLQVTGGSTAPFAPIIVDSLDRLKPCWTETPPPRA